MVGPSAVRRDADALGRPAVVRAGPRRRAIGQRGRIATLPGPWSGDRDTKTQAAAPVTSQTSARPLTRHVDVVVANPPYEADNCDPRSLLLVGAIFCRLMPPRFHREVGGVQVQAITQAQL